jgi:hypothetical protein
MHKLYPFYNNAWLAHAAVFGGLPGWPFFQGFEPRFLLCRL